MRLTLILVIAGCLQVSARGFSQTVTLHRTNSPLESVLSDIHRQTGYSFVYNLEWLSKVPNVNFSVDRVPLKEALDLLLEGQPLSYTFIDRTVVLRWKPILSPKPASGDDAESPKTEILVTIRTRQGQPLSGASVFVKRTHKGYISGANGQCSLDVNPTDTLIVSYVGYKTNKVGVEEMFKNGWFYILMEEASDKLDQMVVQAYGTTSQRLATGNISKVTAEEIAKQPVMNPLMALQGRVPGLVITPTSGYASGTVKVEIRGRNTINPQFVSDPLYIIDGVPLTTLNADQNTNYQTGSPGVIQNGMPSPSNGQSPFFNMNPGDIESIEVLKDADATAIYGSRGANGVILITTKKGHSGNGTSFDASVTEGFSKVTRFWNMMSTPQYLNMRRQAFKNDGITPTINNAPDLLLWDTTRNVNWQKEMWGHGGKVLDAALALSGGDEKTTFRISGDYHRQTEILTRSGANQRGGLAFNLTNHSPNNKLKTNLTASYIFTNIDTRFTPGATTLPPDAPPVYNSTGGLNYGPWDSAGIGGSYPFSAILNPYSSKTGFLNSNLAIDYELVKGLVFTVSVGYNDTRNQQFLAFPIIAQDPAISPNGMASFGTNSGHTWIVEPQLSYTRYIGPGKLSILAGGSNQESNTNGISQFAVGFTSDALINSIANAAFVSNGQNYAQYKYAAIFTRINYNWSNKYILNLTARRDGSSRFGPGRQFGNFGSAGAAWIASEEKWLKKILPTAIDFIKLRSSYGLTGSDAIGDYQYLSQWQNLSANAALLTYSGITPLISQHAVNQLYRWQVNKKLEGALDLGFFRDRLTIEFAYYQDRCNNQLTSYPTPAFTGFSTVVANWPATVQNSGWEFQANGRIAEGKDFSWSGSFNISINRNRLVAYKGIEQSPYLTLYKVGKSLNAVYLLHSTGVDPATGYYQYQDINHDGEVHINTQYSPGTGLDDRGTAIDLSPAFTGGWNNQWNYKNYQLSLFFSFEKQKGANSLISDPAGTMMNQSASIDGHQWQKPGDHAMYARYSTQQSSTDGSYYYYSDNRYSDASFIRLTNVSFSYALPEKVVKKAGMKNCRLSLNAQNLLVITGYKGIDPEIQSFGGMPPARVFVGSLSFNF